MPQRKRFDLFLWAVLALVCVALVVVAGGARPRGAAAAAPRALDRALERNLAYQARIAMLRDIYAPVSALRDAGQPQGALLKLTEIEKSYPGEAHGQILKGEILAELGAWDEAVASYAAAVRTSGDYVDRDSPLSRRAAIQQLVTTGLARSAARLAAQPQNRSAQGTLKELYYLQSRLAGGCE